MADDQQQRELLEENVTRFRMMERDITDTLAKRLVRDIVTELEAALEQPDEQAGSCESPAVISDRRAERKC